MLSFSVKKENNLKNLHTKMEKRENSYGGKEYKKTMPQGTCSNKHRVMTIDITINNDI